MADKDDNTINLAQIQQAEQNTAADDSILASEDELLGIAKPGAGSKGSSAQAAAKKDDTSKFNIPAIVKQKYPKLIPLIIQTESMDDEEREYWFQILPIMTDDQVKKLIDILISEKDQLAKLDSEYESELSKINDKHLQEWQTFESQQQREELQVKETKAEEEESAAEEDLLKKLNEL